MQKTLFGKNLKFKRKKGKRKNLKFKKPKSASPEWENITPELEQYFFKKISANSKIIKELERKKTRRERINKETFNFLRRVQDQGRFNKTAWGIGGAGINTHGLYVAAIRGRLDDIILKNVIIYEKGTIKLSDVKDLHNKGIMPKKFNAMQIYSGLKTGKIKKETAFKIAEELNFTHYIAPYSTKRGKKTITINGHFRNKKK